MKMILLTSVASMLNVSANTLWKKYLLHNPFELKLGNIISLVLSPNIFLGIFAYVISMVIFFYLLSNYKLSVIAPVTSMTYILSMFSGIIVFREAVSLSQVLGVIIIIIGIIFVVK